jgi:hypothetical protein
MRRMKYKMISGLVALAFAAVFALFGDNPTVQKIAALVQNQGSQSSTTAKRFTPPAEERAGANVKYDRDLYDHWIDVDGDCQNARHELLQELSTGQITLNKSGCTVATGRWNDPYTGQIYTVSRDLDIDHMVPLAWAHWHGAHSWDAATRRQFANDKVNLFAVQASANRQKGAKGPLEWMPPDESFHCQYITRFHRIVLMYKLEYSAQEAAEMDQMRAKLCA